MLSKIQHLPTIGTSVGFEFGFVQVIPAGRAEDFDRMGGLDDSEIRGPWF